MNVQNVFLHHGFCSLYIEYKWGEKGSLSKVWLLLGKNYGSVFPWPLSWPRESRLMRIDYNLCHVIIMQIQSAPCSPHFKTNWIFKCLKQQNDCTMTQRAAHPYEHLWDIDSRKAMSPERQAAYSLTWFVTSSVVGLYVVMPCVPTEKTRLYLEQRLVRNIVYPSANTSNSLGSHIILIANAGKRVNVQWKLTEAKWTDHLISLVSKLVIEALNVKMYRLTQKKVNYIRQSASCCEEKVTT